MLNRWVLSRDRKTATEGAETTRSDRLFQTRSAATGKARSPTVDNQVHYVVVQCPGQWTIGPVVQHADIPPLQSATHGLHPVAHKLTAPIHRGMARLSWPGWLVTYGDGLSAHSTNPSSNPALHGWESNSQFQCPNHYTTEPPYRRLY